MKALIAFVKDIYYFGKSVGFRFALKYKLGLAEEGIDYTGCGAHDECWFCPVYGQDRNDKDCVVIQSVRKKRRSRLIKTFKIYDLQ